MVQLHLGSRGSDVLALQQKLKTAGFYSGSLDSSFGPQTLAALKAFQTKAKLKVDGWYGDQSASALASWPTSSTPPTTTTMPNTSIPDPAQLGYNPSGMTGDKATHASDAYKTEMAKEDRTIAEAMNRRGIYGSSIMGENINDAATDLKKRMDQAWASAYARGYATNDEAALLGLTPGQVLRSIPKSGDATFKGSDGTLYDKDKNIIWSTDAKAKWTTFKNSFNSHPQEAMYYLINSGLTQSQIEYVIDSMVQYKVNGRTSQEWYDYVLNTVLPTGMDPNKLAHFNRVGEEAQGWGDFAESIVSSAENQRRNHSAVDPFLSGGKSKGKTVKYEANVWNPKTGTWE